MRENRIEQIGHQECCEGASYGQAADDVAIKATR